MKHEETKKSLYVMSHDYTSLTKVGVAINPASRAVQLKNMIGSELMINFI